MLMRCFEKFKKITKLTNYGLREELRERGYKISTQALDNYDRPTATGVRGDVHTAFDELAEDLTGREFVFTKLLHEEFSLRKAKKA